MSYCNNIIMSKDGHELFTKEGIKVAAVYYKAEEVFKMCMG